MLQKVTRLSVPVTVLCRSSGTLSLSKGALAAVSQLETAQKLSLKSEAAGTLRDWFHQDLESSWEKLQKENARKQGVLLLSRSRRASAGQRD